MDLEDLVAVHEISALKYRYLRALDQKEWRELETCLSEDVTASYGGGAYEFGSRAEIMSFLEDSLGRTTILTSHRVSQPEIDRTGPDDATGTWALQDMVVDVEHGVTVWGAAFYEDRYRREGGNWLIVHTGYRRTFEEIFPRSSIEYLQLTAHWWDTGGRSLLAPEPK